MRRETCCHAQRLVGGKQSTLSSERLTFYRSVQTEENKAVFLLLKIKNEASQEWETTLSSLCRNFLTANRLGSVHDCIARKKNEGSTIGISPRGDVRPERVDCERGAGRAVCYGDGILGHGVLLGDDCGECRGTIQYLS